MQSNADREEVVEVIVTQRENRQDRIYNSASVKECAALPPGNSTPRMANLELLRCIAMMMVVVLHFLSKGNLLGDLTEGNLTTVELAAWVLEVFCIVAVNVYMLISGYFLGTSSFKLGRLLRLWLQVWMYSVGVGLLAAFAGILPAEECDIHYFLSLLFPISMGHYWFMTAYVFLYLLLPLIGMAVRVMTKRQMQVALAGIFLMFSMTKSILPFRLEMDGQGYDVLWYVCVFLVAAYLRKFGFPFLKERWRCICLYVFGCLAVLAETLCLQQVYLKTGSFELIMKIATEYNHLFPFLAAIGLFMTFLSVRVSEGMSKVIKRVAPYTLGVYLLHENMGVRYAWQNWFGADKVSGILELLFYTLTAVIVVFAVGVFVDWLRECIVRGLHKVLVSIKCYRKLNDKILALDILFVEKSKNI